MRKESSVTNQGFSLVELVVAAAIFALVILGLTGIFIMQQRTWTAAGGRTRALGLAEEGLEVTRQLRDVNFNNLTDGPHGLLMASNKWQWSGINDVTDDYTRTVTISTPSANLKQIISSVTWTERGLSKQVSLTSYLTNWQTSSQKGGMLVYADYSGAKDLVKYKILNMDSGIWSAEQTVPDDGVPLDRDVRAVRLFSSNTRNEKILITKHVLDGVGNDQYIYAQVWNGMSWGNTMLLSSWPGILRPEIIDFDGAYLNNGNFLVVFEDGGNTPKYRIWNGSAWSAVSNITNVGGKPDYLVLRNKPGTNEAMLASRDALLDTNTSYFNGTAWSAAVEHGTSGFSLNDNAVDFQWSPQAPNTGALIFNEANDNFPNIRIWNGTAWSASVENIDIGGQVRSMQLSGRLGANEFLGCFKDSVNDVNCLKSNFTPLWSTLTNGELTADTDTGTQRSFSVAFEPQSGNPAIAVYASGNTPAALAVPKFRSYNAATSAWSSEGTLNTVTTNLKTIELKPNPTNDDIMVVMGAGDQDLWTVVWNGTSDNFYSTGPFAQTEQSINGSFNEDFWFDFAWDKF